MNMQSQNSAVVDVTSKKGQRGATLVEYALIIAAIAIAVLVGGTALSGNLKSFFDEEVSGALESAQTGDDG